MVESSDEVPNFSIDNPLDFIELDGITAPIIKAGGAADSWRAICCATSSLPPFRRYVVMPVAAQTSPSLAAQFNLIETGGTDFYGDNKPLTSSLGTGKGQRAYDV